MLSEMNVRGGIILKQRKLPHDNTSSLNWFTSVSCKGRTNVVLSDEAVVSCSIIHTARYDVTCCHGLWKYKEGLKLRVHKTPSNAPTSIPTLILPRILTNSFRLTPNNSHVHGPKMLLVFKTHRNRDYRTDIYRK
jgi:hypothetical protein